MIMTVKYLIETLKKIPEDTILLQSLNQFPCWPAYGDLEPEDFLFSQHRVKLVDSVRVLYNKSDDADAINALCL